MVSIPPQAQKFRIRAGESVVGRVQSGAAPTWRARARGRYDRGDEFDLTITENTLTGTDRSNVVAKASDPAAYDGVITEAVLEVDGQTIQRGAVWGQLVIARGNGLRNGESQVLCRGYPCPANALTLGVFEAPGTGAGWIHTETGADPAAGAEVNDNVVSNVRWVLRSHQTALVTDATVGNRSVQLVATDINGVRKFVSGATANHAASLTRTHLFAQGNESPTTATASALTDTIVLLSRSSIPSGGVPLTEGDVIRTITFALVAGDNFGIPSFVVEEWVMPT